MRLIIFLLITINSFATEIIHLNNTIVDIEITEYTFDFIDGLTDRQYTIDEWKINYYQFTEEMEIISYEYNNQIVWAARYETTLTVENYKNINIYPNPTTGIIRIKGIDDLYVVVIFDEIGREVFKKKDIRGELNISDLKQGVYMLCIVKEKEIITKKIIKI